MVEIEPPQRRMAGESGEIVQIVVAQLQLFHGEQLRKRCKIGKRVAIGAQPPQLVEFFHAGECREPQCVERHVGGIRRKGLTAENDGVILRLMDDLAVRQRRLQRVDAFGGNAVVVFKIQVCERAQRREKVVIEIAPPRGAEIERRELRQQSERGDVRDRVVREIQLAQLGAAGERGNVRDAAAGKVERFDRFGEVQPAERHRARALYDAVAEYAAARQSLLQILQHIVHDLHTLQGERRERRE